ncbi:MAG: hypothetical protein AB9836_08125 [Aminipila sp.]
MKKFTFKGRKHAVTATCLIAGMFVLTSAVYANYDDSRGYTNYKDAVKDLVLYQDSFTANGEMAILVDGKEMATVKGDLKLDGDDYYWKTVSEDSFSDRDNKYENIQVRKDGKNFSYYPETNSYTVSDAENDFRPDMSDPTMKKGVRFAELFADAMVGDLKNNFVLESKEGDNRTYSVDVSGSQIPEVVNAGISLMFTAANNQENLNPYDVTYENYQKSLAAYYKEKTGKEMTEAMYNDWNKEIEKINEDFSEKYYDVLESKGNGIVYVKADGTYDYYKTYEEYNKNVQSNALNDRNIMKLLGNDPYIDSATCKFTLDKAGNIISDDMEASMTGVDSKGKKHTITMKINYKVSDYDTTKVDAFDTTGKTKQN